MHSHDEWAGIGGSLHLQALLNAAKSRGGLAVADGEDGAGEEADASLNMGRR